MIAATIVADSVNQHGDRLTTFELTLPKSLVAQFNTHGMVRRNSASSRAIPTRRVISQVESDPYLPAVWRYRADHGMQPGMPMSDADAERMDNINRSLRNHVIGHVREMDEMGAAKEDINHYLGPWMWTTVVATATEWENYFKQRDHDDTQAPHALLAHKMREAMDGSNPVERFGAGVAERDLWHLPYITGDERATLRVEILPRLSTVRCARVSYGRQGVATDVMDELRRYDDFPRLGHWSPLEMPCRADNKYAYRDANGWHSDWHGPYRGWKPLRKMYGGESGTDRHGTQCSDERWTTL